MAGTREEQIAGAKIRQYDIYKNGVLLGFTAPDTTSANIEGQYADLSVDQIPGVVKSTTLGFPITVEATLYDATAEGIALALKGQVQTNTDGVNTNIEFGIEKRESQEFAEELLLHPSGIPLTDRSGDITIFKAYVKAEAISLNSSQTEYQTLQLTIVSQPDLSKSDSKVYAVIGDPSLDSVTPLAVYVSLDGDVRLPYKSATAATIGVSTLERLNAIVVNGTDSGEDILINNAGGYLPSDTVFDYDGLTSQGALIVGSVLQFTTEYMVVTALTATQVTVVRGAFGTTPVALADNDVLNIFNAVSFTNRRSDVAWSSDDLAVATVGDTYAASTQVANKGVIAGVAVGTANITATWNAVSSPNFALGVA